MAFNDMASGNAALKEFYDDQKVINMAYVKNPFLAMVPKDPDYQGKNYPVPVAWGIASGSSTFANAQANQSPSQYAEFLVTPKKDYSIATIANDLLLSSRGDAGAFVDFAKTFIDDALKKVSNRVASGLFRSGTGSIGAISSIAAGVITLTNASDVSQFEVNDTIQANSTDGGTPRAALGYVIARNVQSGTITVSATAMGGAAGTPSGWQAADFLLVQGDLNSKQSGLQAWLPSVAPGPSDNFYGVNRSPDSRLYGLAYAGAQQPIEEALIDASMILCREGGSPSHFFTNYGSQSALLKALGARREWVDWESEDATIGFRGVKVQGPEGVIESYIDRSCQAATGYLLTLENWKLISLKQVPHIFESDTLEILRVVNEDALAVRANAYSNLTSNAPGYSSQVALGV